MSGKIVAGVVAIAVSSASAATVGVVYTRIAASRHVEDLSPVGETSPASGPVRSAVVLNASESLFGSPAESSGDGDAPVCPGADGTRGCVVVARASNIHVNILGYGLTIPPFWFGGDSQDTYYPGANGDFWQVSDPIRDLEVVVRAKRRHSSATGSLDSGDDLVGPTATNSQSGSQGAQTNETTSFPASPAVTGSGQLIEFDFPAVHAHGVAAAPSIPLPVSAALLPVNPPPADFPTVSTPSVEPPPIAPTPVDYTPPWSPPPVPPGPPIFVSGPPTGGPPGTSDPPGVPTAPEPSTWAMIILGFAALGLVTRGRAALAAFKTRVG